MRKTDGVRPDAGHGKTGEERGRMTYILYNPLANGGHGVEGAEAVRGSLPGEAAELLDLTGLDVSAFLTGLPAEKAVAE